MEALKQKLKGRQGASFLLALALLLLCVMVAASLLTAAVSNAGKVRSNKEEQQKYLTLSSALRLVCGELEKASYRGQYQYSSADPVPDIPATDTTPAVPGSPGKRGYTQEGGRFTCALQEVLPLERDLDALFRGQFTLPGAKRDNKYDYSFERLGDAALSPRGPYTLRLTAQTDEGAYPGLGETVTILAEVRSSGFISLTATLESPAGAPYVMEAELIPSGAPAKLFVLKGAEASTAELNQTEEMTWKVNWIAKKEAQADETQAP